MNRRDFQRPILAALALSSVLACAAPASAVDLYKPGAWPALASDRLAGEIGDSLTVLVYETSNASNSIQRGSGKKTRLGGEVGNKRSVTEAGNLDLEGSYTGTGQTARTGRMVAQITVIVDEILPNGDLLVSGQQLLTVNSERTTIKLRGRVRRADISSANTVLSSRIADAMIDYDGSGFASRSAQPGVLMVIFNLLGLL